MLAQVIGWEWGYPELSAKHFLTVATYNLQHSAEFANDAIEGLRAAFIQHLDHSLPVERIRHLIAREYEGKRRVKKPEVERRCRQCLLLAQKRAPMGLRCGHESLLFGRDPPCDHGCAVCRSRRVRIQYHGSDVVGQIRRGANGIRKGSRILIRPVAEFQQTIGDKRNDLLALSQFADARGIAWHLEGKTVALSNPLEIVPGSQGELAQSGELRMKEIEAVVSNGEPAQESSPLKTDQTRGFSPNIAKALPGFGTREEIDDGREEAPDTRCLAIHDDRQ